jgi:EAL domain-containing protein (putative c-di-GMP-specific phosphodiesterase class I)
MTELCHDMGRVVIAEGIESLAERDAIADLGCEKMQGYLFAKPGLPFPAVSW